MQRTLCGADQTEGEDGSTVRVDAVGGRHHCDFRRKADPPELGHARPPLTGTGEVGKEGMDRVGAARQRAGVHVAMAPGVDQADEAWLGPCRQFVEHRGARQIGDAPRVGRAWIKGRDAD
jgi:hypothetical protein